MRITSRLRDSRRAGAFVLLLVSASLVIHCSSEGESSNAGAQDSVVADAGSDTSAPSDASEPSQDAGVADARPTVPDLQKSDAGPQPVTCADSPCATALETSFGTDAFCALLQDGTVACWGQNAFGELGRGAAGGTSDSFTPARVAGVSNVTSLHHTCAIDANGATWCWGKGPFLRSTVTATTTERAPVQLAIPAATKVAFSTNVGCALVQDGLLCWGANADGQLAVPAFGASTTKPIAAATMTIPAGAPLRDVVVGNASFVVREDGTVWSWGANPPLGRVSSLFPDPYPGQVELAGVSGLDVEGHNACAVAEGIAYCWGSANDPFDGQRGDLPLARALPEIVATPEPIVQISTTIDTGVVQLPQRHCAVGVSGAVYCWGNNGNGQVGDGTRDYAAVPVKITSLPGPAAQVKATPRSTCALLTSGKIWCWGDNGYGQLGDGQTKETSLVPKEVALP